MHDGIGKGFDLPDDARPALQKYKHDGFAGLMQASYQFELVPGQVEFIDVGGFFRCRSLAEAHNDHVGPACLLKQMLFALHLSFV